MLLRYGQLFIKKKDCISLENVQRWATRMVHSIRHFNYTERMRELGLPSLQYKRSRADMIEVFFFFFFFFFFLNTE